MIAVLNLIFLFLCSQTFVQTQTQERLERDIVPDKFTKARPVKPGAALRRRVRYRRVGPRLSARARSSRATQLGLTIWRLRRATAAELGERIIVQEEGEIVDWIPERLGTRTPLRFGEKIRLSFESRQEGHLYVINREQYASGRLGEPLLIFPTTRTRNGDNRVDAGRLIEIPSQEDRPNFFTLRRSRLDQTGEQLIALITPHPLADLKIGAKPLKLTAELVKGWEQAWGANSEQFEMATGAGKPWTRVEREAGADITRRLTQDDPSPQTVYHIAAGPDKPRLIKVILRYVTPQPLNRFRSKS